MKLLLIFVLVSLVHCERKVIFVSKHVVCKEYNKNYYHNFTCGMKLIDKKRRSYFLNYYMKSVTLENWHVRKFSEFSFKK